MISFNLQTLDFTKDINDLIYQIDKKIYTLVKQQVVAIKFGSCTKMNVDDFKRLVRYKEILIQKSNNYTCLSSFSIDNIISRIKQLLNRN